MDHSSYIRTPENARNAVLFLHGICSSPRHFDFLVPEFDDSWAVYNMLIRGHGGTPKDFANASMKQWKAQTRELLDLLSQRYDNILLVGYSMGTMLEIAALPHYPKVRAMLLLNAPMRPHVRMNILPRLFRRKLTVDPAIREACERSVSIAVTPGVMQYIGWAPRFLELLLLCRHCRHHKKNIQVPCVVYLGTNDELVSIRSRRYFEKNPHVTLRIMEGGGHLIYPEESVLQMQEDLRQLIRLF